MTKIDDYNHGQITEPVIKWHKAPRKSKEWLSKGM